MSRFLLQVLALSFYKVLALYCLAVKYNISECGYPVTEEYAARTLAQRQININVTVTKDKAVNRRMFLEVFTRKEYAPCGTS